MRRYEVKIWFDADLEYEIEAKNKKQAEERALKLLEMEYGHYHAQIGQIQIDPSFGENGDL